MYGIAQTTIALFIISPYGFGQNRFVDYCGLKHGTISRIKVEGPSAEIVPNISNNCPELILNKLFGGEADGAMLIIAEPHDKAKVADSPSHNNVHRNQQVMIANW